MRKIPALPFGVHACSLIPYVGHDEFFVDPNVQLTEPRLLISKTGCVELAKMAGWVDPEVHVALADANVGLLSEIEQLRAELDDERKVNEAIDVIESKDFRARRKAGRKPKEVAA